MIDHYSWITVYPEIVLLTLACVITLVDLGVKSANRHTTYVLTLLTLGIVAFMQAADKSKQLGGQTVSIKELLRATEAK